MSDKEAGKPEKKARKALVMTAEDFCYWLAVMKARGFNKRQCGELLERGAPWVTRAQRDGAEAMVAYACAAIFAGLNPYPEPPSPRRRIRTRNERRG
ncbi:hypothetical protein ACC806_34685 [Rhizobium ruizarguesonis]